MAENTLSDILSVSVDSNETRFYNLSAANTFNIGLNNEITLSTSYSTIPGLLVTTASYALTSSFINTLNQNVIISGNLSVNGTTYLNNVVVNTASYSSGSNIFGDSLSDTHQFTGSVFITGSSFTWNNNTLITNNITSSMSVLNAQTASFIDGGTF